MELIIEYFSQHHSNIYYTLAGISLIVEIGVIGLSGPLLFFSVGCAVTGVLVSLGVISGWELEVLSVGVFSTLSAVLLWKPLKKFQGSKKFVKDQSSDMIGQIVPVTEDVTVSGGLIRHSGINWMARLDDDAGVESLAVGQRVVITETDGNIMVVKSRG